MSLYVLLGTETAGYTVVIDGRTYRPPLLDGSGRLLVALDLTAIAPPTTLHNGVVTVTTAGTRVQFSNQAVIGVSIKADPGNAGVLYLGDSGVDSSNGRVIEAGGVVDLAIDNLNRLYVDSAEDGDKLSYLAVA
ncbi:MAG: hypothetical protein V3S20_05650 [Dehalococcoidia bacterium]